MCFLGGNMLVAEIGLNHCGSQPRAQNILERLMNTNVDAITFQIREKDFYDGTHPRKVELTDEYYLEAISLVHRHNKKFGIALAQPEKVGFLKNNGCDFFKTLSWDLPNVAFQETLQHTGKKVYASTGLSGLDDIVGIGKRFPQLAFIHTQLNNEISGANLRAIETMRNATMQEVGFGLHCQNLNVLYVAVAFEPCATFFYVKDDTDGEHPDDEYALNINQVDEMTTNMKQLAQALGTGEKTFKENTLHPDDDDVTTDFQPGVKS